MVSQTLKPKVVSSEEVNTFNFPDAEQISVLLSREDTGGAFSLFRGTVPPNVGQPLHIHRFEDEVFHVLKGEVTIQVGDDHYSAKAGTAAFLPKGIPHAYHNHAKQEAEVLVIVTPSGLEGFLGETLALMASGEADMEAMGAISEKYGIEMLGDGTPA